MNSSALKSELRRKNDRTETLLPHVTKSTTLKADPNRANDRMLKLEPSSEW
jgi:predicted translin family RNA/ssDNA-binding protein